MAVTVTYSLNFVKNLDLTEGPAIFGPDATSLANGGFAISGDWSDSNSSLDIFKADANIGGGSGSILGTNSAVDQLPNGNIVVASQDDGLRFTIKTATGGHVTSIQLSYDNEQLPDVTALTGGGFWLAGHKFDGTQGDIDVYRRNNDGSFAGVIAVDTSDADDRSVSIASLDNGNVAVAWERFGSVAGSKVWYAIYDAAGGVIKPPTAVASAGDNSEPSVSATADGFVLTFNDNGWGTGGLDISQQQFSPAGGYIRDGNVSNPGFITDGTDEHTSSVARLSNDFLAVAYQRTGGGDSDAIVALVHPVTGAVLATRNVLGGEPVTDVAIDPSVTGFARGGIAVFQGNATDSDVDGEHLQAQRTSVGDAAADLISGDSFRDVMYGGGGNDGLRGFDGNDTLSGGRGNDTLVGGRGIDSLSGGGGGDRFDFNRVTESGITAATRDHIADFVHLTDDIDLRTLDAKTGTPGNDTFVFKGTQAFNAEGQVRVVQSGNHTIVQLNTTGRTGAEMTIQLDNFTATALGPADFFF